MKNYTYIILIFLSLKAFSKNKTDFFTKDFFEKLVIAERTEFNRGSSEYVKGSMSNLLIVSKSQDGNTKKIRAGYLIKSLYGKQEISKDTKYIEVIYEKGLPYSVSFSYGLYYYLPYEISPEIKKLFNEIQIKQIFQLNKRYREITRLKNQSYISLRKKLDKYPSYKDIKNSIQKIESTTFYRITTQKEVQITADRDMIVDDYSYTSFSKVLLKNISNKAILIKGIGKNFISLEEGYVYEDESILLQPGEETEELIIFPKYDDYYDQDPQYIEN